MAIDCGSDTCQLVIDMTQVTDLYDTLNARIRADLQEDYDCKKINGATFADTWAKLISQTINSAIGAGVSLATKETAADRCVKEAECNLRDAQTAKTNYETSEILPANKAQIIRQTEGFDDNLRQKLFDSQMNSWAMMFSSGLLEDKPSIISNDEVSQLYNGIKNEVEMYLGHWTSEISVSGPNDALVFTWGAVVPINPVGNITYEVEIISSELGMLPDYPLVTTASATAGPINGGVSSKHDIVIVANINAKDEAGKTTFSSVTKRIPKI